MLLPRCIRSVPFARGGCSRQAARIRRSSTASPPLPGPVTGQSGRTYTPTKLLYSRFHSNWDFHTRIYEAKYDNQSFVLKQPIPRYYEQALDIAAEFPDGSQYLRHPTDHIKEPHTLVYPYYKTTLLDLITEFPEFPVVERLKVLRHVAQGIKELHDREWLHLDIKPDNILLHWESSPPTGPVEGQVVTSAVLSDFDISLKIPPMPNPDRYTIFNLQHAVGNVHWRSPEAQTGLGLTKASDVYSFALVCLYTLGASEYLIIPREERARLIEEDIPDELHVLVQHMCYFEPTEEEFDGLLKHMAGDEVWRERLGHAFEQAKSVIEKYSDQKLSCWGKELGEEMVGLVLGMTRMDPRKRLTIGEVLESEVFNI
ncbi:kinase-like domain-containing protein [Triangularia verruculosa]|uniref:Kinase-like domain-containing protein n=1 Tax=Triangularia verruculosa TaxID=2587418 RepID=A0AAN7ATS6_9PEZI|nr:kinase-like domain-containing protein [Triangularia verruculosa]